MNLFNSLLLVLTLSTPALATPTDRTEFTSFNLIQTLLKNGIEVTVDNSEYCKGDTLGAYYWIGMKRSVHLCPDGEVDAWDHATLRHEVWHAIQHCANTMRGTHKTTPVMELSKLKTHIYRHLTQAEIDHIKENYPETQWNIELEAAVAERILGPDQINDTFLKVCVADGKLDK